MLKLRSSQLFLVIILLLTACTPKADFDIRGEWDYTMVTANGNTYDAGTIDFSGQPEKGTYLETNIYEVEYDGEFTLAGSTLTLTGDETWQGNVTETAINGSWSHDDGESGTFNAVRK